MLSDTPKWVKILLKDPSTWVQSEKDFIAWVILRLLANDMHSSSIGFSLNNPIDMRIIFIRLVIKQWLIADCARKWLSDIVYKLPSIGNYNPEDSFQDYFSGDKLLADLTSLDHCEVIEKGVQIIRGFIWTCLLNYCRDCRRQELRLLGIVEEFDNGLHGNVNEDFDNGDALGENFDEMDNMENIEAADNAEDIDEDEPDANDELDPDGDFFNIHVTDQEIQLIESIKAEHLASWREVANCNLVDYIPLLPERQRQVFTLTYGESPSIDLELHWRLNLPIYKLEALLAKKIDVDPSTVIWLPWEVDFITGNPVIKMLVQLRGININDKETLFLILPTPIRSVDDIMDILKLTKSNVRATQSMARQRIRQLFQDNLA